MAVYNMKRFLILIFTLLLLSQNFQAQNFQINDEEGKADSISSGFKFIMFPTGNNFMPIKTDYEEPRLGVQYLIRTDNLKVDIGNSVDLFGFKFPNEKIYATLSIDFFAYALATSFEGHRLQIDALDGFFGGNGALTKRFGKDKMQIRLRIVHNSAHFVDGHYDRRTHDWKDGDAPIPYTRDSGILTAAYIFNKPDFSLKLYSAISYATLVRPSSMKKWLGYSGFELNFPHLFERVQGSPVNVFLASHLFLDANPDYTINSNSMLGVKFGKWHGKGIIFYLDFFSGHHYLSQYFREKTDQIGIGFFVDFY